MRKPPSNVVVHSPHTKRHQTGWQRWFAVCPCGWTRAGSGKLGAERLVALHARMNPAPEGGDAA